MLSCEQGILLFNYKKGCQATKIPTTQAIPPGRMTPNIGDMHAERHMPRVFHVMRKEPDDLPTVGDRDLGVRPGIDVDVDAQSNVQVNGKGMSVATNWRTINHKRIPRRLRPILPGAMDSTAAQSSRFIRRWQFRLASPFKSLPPAHVEVRVQRLGPRAR